MWGWWWSRASDSPVYQEATTSQSHMDWIALGNVHVLHEFAVEREAWSQNCSILEKAREYSAFTNAATISVGNDILSSFVGRDISGRGRYPRL